VDGGLEEAAFLARPSFFRTLDAVPAFLMTVFCIV
jgi:hypothetical protein